MPSGNCIVISRANNSIYVNDSTSKKLIAVSSSSGNNLTNEKITLSIEDINRRLRILETALQNNGAFEDFTSIDLPQTLNDIFSSHS